MKRYLKFLVFTYSEIEKLKGKDHNMDKEKVIEWTFWYW
jgi:hypothetical protein